MKIIKIEVRNYRLLKEFSIDLEDELSLVVGKNNCGKTSLLSILDKFLNGSAGSFSFDDFNLDYKEELKKLFQSDIPEGYVSNGIALKLYIQYDNSDDLSNISSLMMDLDPNNNMIVLLFEFVLTKDNLKKLKNDFVAFQEKESLRKKNKQALKGLDYFFTNECVKNFCFLRKTIDSKDSDVFIDIDKEKISLSNVINFEHIKANRDVSNKDTSKGGDKTLSSLSAKIYEKIEADDSHQLIIDRFKDGLFDADVKFGEVYQEIFKETIEKVRQFGGIKPDDTQIAINSTLQHINLMKGNTTVMYKHGDSELPEHYNGLGYMNLIGMIFEIEILLNKFKRKLTEKPADINLLFIEEPEAHTHPQMQYIFIRNIKDLLKGGVKRTDGVCRPLQYIISTHSSHIVSESVFDDIKYLRRLNNTNAVIAKNLKNLKNEYHEKENDKSYRFLKQYLTLCRAELFFADKVIFIEGDTERVLLPAMMKKLDLENSENPMLSQNISIIEVGNYAHVFEKLIDFIGIKSLIVTDIDSEYSEIAYEDDGTTPKKCANGKNKMKTVKCRADDPKAIRTSNSSLEFFYGSDSLADFKDKKKEDMLLIKKEVKQEDGKVEKKWCRDEKGILLCICQSKEKNAKEVEYHARSFEDAFFHLNRQFIVDNKDSFGSLKHISNFKDESKDSYCLAEECIDKKPSFAIEILLNSNEGFSNWAMPKYVRQGLLWLKD